MFTKRYAFNRLVQNRSGVELGKCENAKIKHIQRSNGPVNNHLISGPTVSITTSKKGQGRA